MQQLVSLDITSILIKNIEDTLVKLKNNKYASKETFPYLFNVIEDILIASKQKIIEIKNEIKEFLRKTVAPYKVPKFIEFKKELPETLVGKVLRKDLKDIEARKRGEEV